MMRQANNFPEAIELHTEAIKPDGNNHFLYSDRSIAHLSHGDVEAALSDGIKCIEVNPDLPESYSRKGAALHALKRFDEAEETYQAGVSHCFFCSLAYLCMIPPPNTCIHSILPVFVLFV
jgi:stress-induced-phosphoprotein 1